MTGALAETTAALARSALPTVDSMWSLNIPPNEILLPIMKYFFLYDEVCCLPLQAT